MLIFVLIVSGILLYLILSTIKPSNYPPGPAWLPIVGNTFLLKKLSQKYEGQYAALLKLSEEYNSDIVGLKLGNECYVVVYGRKLVQEVFTRSEFQGRPDGFFIRLRTLGTKRGISMTDGLVWHQQRSFAEKNLKRLGFHKCFLTELIQNELTGLFDVIGDEKTDIFLNTLISPSFLNILWTIVGGKESLKNSRRQLDELLDLLRQRSKAFDMAGGLLNQLPWIRFIAPNYSGYRMISTLNRKLFALIQGIINEHKRTLTNETRDFIDAYLHEMASQSADTTTFTDEQLIATCLDFFIAGALTTSSTLDSAILLVLQHPEVKKKLYNSLDSTLSPNTLPSIDDKDRLPYVEAILSETQRLQHVVPTAGPRRVLKDTQLGGYSIPKESVVLLSLRSIHHDIDRWENPTLFEPERFLDASGQRIIDEGLCFFGLGKRRCPGEILAKNYMFLTFVSLFQRYDITLRSSKEELLANKKPAGILSTPPDYKVSLRLRKHVNAVSNGTISNGHLPHTEDDVDN